MKQIFIPAFLIAALVVAFMFWQNTSQPTTVNTTTDKERQNNDAAVSDELLPTITPISHATFVLTWGETVIYNDPVGGPEVFVGKPPADIVLVSDIHGDHLNVETLEAVVGETTSLIVPRAVAELLPEALASRATILANGEDIVDDIRGLTIEALPMYNLPEQGIEIRHEKGRGNGYLIERDGVRVYIAGDTAAIPEMRALSNIAIAFVPMNLPFTMSVKDAAAAVVAFAPVHVYPYHYRTPDGPADVARFKELVFAGNQAIDVVQLDWYPSTN